VRDQNAYTGPFTKRTANKFRIVGNYWDPARNFQGDVSSRRSRFWAERK